MAYGSEDSGQLSDMQLDLLKTILEGKARFTDIRNALDLSKPYLSDLLTKLVRDGWIEHDKIQKKYSIPKAKIPNVKKMSDSRFGFLQLFSKDLLPTAEFIKTIPNREDRKNAFKELFTIYFCMVVREAIFAMELTKQHRNKERAFQSAKSSYFHSIPNTLNILNRIVCMTEEVDASVLYALDRIFLEIDDKALRKFVSIMPKTSANEEVQAHPN
jgi:hypothetical protein